MTNEIMEEIQRIERDFLEIVNIIISHDADISKRLDGLAVRAAREERLEDLSQTCEYVCSYFLAGEQSFQNLQHASIAMYHAAKIAEVARLDYKRITYLYNKASQICREVSDKATDLEIRNFASFLSEKFAANAKKYMVVNKKTQESEPHQGRAGR